MDCFGGAGTTGLVADRLGRNAILIELNPEYAAIAERRIRGDSTLFADIAVEQPVTTPEGPRAYDEAIREKRRRLVAAGELPPIPGYDP